MKKRILIVAIMVTCGVAYAQNGGKYTAPDRALKAEDTAVVKPKGWVRSFLLDDWFLQAQGGGQLYYGSDDTRGPFGDRLTWNGEFGVGRRIFPMFGFRATLGFGYAHGFITKDHYNTNRLSILTHGYSGQCGTDINGDPLGGYYYDYDDNLLIQKWKYMYTGADLFLDLDILRGTKNYNPFKKWNNIIYGGVHVRFGMSETDSVNHRSEAHVGYILKYNFNQNWSIYGDIRGSFIEREFDREWIPEIETTGAGVDFVFNAHVGVMFRFHARTEDQRSEFTIYETDIDTMVLMSHIITHVSEEIIHEEKVVDTFLSYIEHVSPTPEWERGRDSLLHIIDSLRNAQNNNINDMPLDSILLKRLLPYEMVFFQLDKWDILPNQQMKIDKMARIMQAYPNATFIITGSADSKTGTPKRNDFLSHCRADVVYNVLVNEYGIDPSRLRREYLGGILEYQPFQLNRTTVIIMDHPAVMRAFNEMKSKGQAGGGEVSY